MRLTSFTGAALMGALLVASSAAHAVLPTVTDDHDQYTITYQTDTPFGYLSHTGSGSSGGIDHLSFGWNSPFNGNNAEVLAAPGQDYTVQIPSFTLVAKSGYVLSNLTFTIGGSVFSFGGTAPSAETSLDLGLSTAYTGSSGVGEWQLSGTLSTGPYSTLSFSGGTLTLHGNNGYIFAGRTTGPEFLFNVTAVPEPEGFALALAGAGVALLVLRRRQRA